MSHEPAPGLDDPDEEEHLQFLAFELGDVEFAVGIDDVDTVTEPPAELTRVPRAPRTIDGLTDLRGEITAVVDPRPQFPVPDETPDDEKLLVFDRRSDRQGAALRVDAVNGVESVPERDVVGAGDLDAGETPTAVADHPLVDGFVRRSGDDADESATDRAGIEAVDERRLGDRATLVGESGRVDPGPAGDSRPTVRERSFEFGADDPEPAPDAAGRSTVAAAVIDVEKLLFASGPSGGGEPAERSR